MPWTSRRAAGDRSVIRVSSRLTNAIASALKLARPVSKGLIFPGARKRFDPLPFKGHALRHTFLSVAADLGIDELQRRMLTRPQLPGDQSILHHPRCAGRRTQD